VNRYAITNHIVNNYEAVSQRLICKIDKIGNLQINFKKSIQNNLLDQIISLCYPVHMSTEKSITKLNKSVQKGDRFAQIARIGEVVFHAKDLANLWQIKDPNTLYTAIKRYIKRGSLFRIYKGFYSIKPIEQIDPLFLGIKALHEFAYVSAETVLFNAGIIQQKVSAITLVSSKSENFSIGDNQYISRKLNDKYLFNSAGIFEKDGIKTASVERAIADLLYFNSKAHFDADKLINWKKVKKLQKEIGYPLIARLG
jgi:Tfp pilus assembly protein PilZ